MVKKFYAKHNSPIKALLCVLIGLAVYFLPKPELLEPKAWKLFAIFFGTIVGIILRPYPMGATTLFGLCIAILTGVLSIEKEALSGFGLPIIWLIVLVFFLSRGFIKTHLGTRMAYYFVSILGRRTLSLGYGIVISEFFMAPLIPSNTARAGGIILPIVQSICSALGSDPKHGTEKKIGSYLITLSFQTNIIASAIFLTASAVNPIVQEAAASMGIIITWGNWFAAAIVPGLISLAVAPLFLYYVYPPEEKYITNAVEFAQDKLRELGPLSIKEISMIFIFLLMLVLWAMEAKFGINATTVAFIGLSLCLLTNILTVEDILKEKEAWHTLIWLSILVTMATYLNKFGFIQWFSLVISQFVAGYTGFSALILLSLVYFYSHYLFAGNSSQVTAMYAAFVSVCIGAGAPPFVTVLLFGFISSLYGSMTHYGSGAAPLFFGTGYVSMYDWWKLGFLMSIINIIIWFGAGMVWWKIIGIM